MFHLHADGEHALIEQQGPRNNDWSAKCVPCVTLIGTTTWRKGDQSIFPIYKRTPVVLIILEVRSQRGLSNSNHR